jgi:prepilin-type processing-associated H-X9-DG protein
VNFKPATTSEEPMFDISFSSYHPGGAHMSRCDGSVGFLSDGIDIRVLQALGSRNGDEVISSSY